MEVRKNHIGIQVRSRKLLEINSRRRSIPVIDVRVERLVMSDLSNYGIVCSRTVSVYR